MRLNSITKISAISLFTFFSLFSICFAKEPTLFQGVVNAEKINIRSDSTVSSQIICNVDKGKCVEVVEELYGWYKIRLPKNAPSFIRRDLVSIISDGRATVIKNRVNIRLEADESSPILGSANKSEIINILISKGEWYRIEPVADSFGWIYKKFVDRLPPKEISAENKIDTEVLD